MDQSTYIAGTIIAGFVIFVTVRGELPRYMGFLFGSPNQAAPTITPQQFGFSAPSGNASPAGGGGQANSSSMGDYVKMAETAVEFLAL